MATNQTHLASLMCMTRSNFSELVKEIEALGYEVIITSAFRSQAHQKKLYEELKKEKGGRAAKRSNHGLGMAIDLNLKKDGKWWKKATSKSEWESTGVPTLAKSLGFRWGGDFATNYDPVHFDMKNRVTENKLKGELKTFSPSFDRIFYCQVEGFYRQYLKAWVE